MTIHTLQPVGGSGPAAIEPLIEIEDLWRTYRGRWGRNIHALNGVNLTVARGEVVGLLGPNGAGKTTALKILLGMLRPSRGRVRLFGRPVGDLEARRRLGFLAEQPYYYDYLTAAEFLDLCGVLCGLSTSDRRRRTAGLLEQVGLARAASTRLRKYSKGMLQRLGVAQALLHEPELVILDEPMSGLDPLGRGLVRDIILNLKQNGTTILFSSHILPDVENLCDRVAILAAGRVVVRGTVADLTAESDPAFEIVGQNVPPMLARIFINRGEAVRTIGRRTIIEAPDRAAMNRVVGEILGSGAELVNVAPRKSPLEAHFLAAAAPGEEGWTLHDGPAARPDTAGAAPIAAGDGHDLDGAAGDGDGELKTGTGS